MPLTCWNYLRELAYSSIAPRLSQISADRTSSMDKPSCVICFSPEVRRYFEVRNSPFFQNVLSDDKLSANGVPLVNCEFWLCSNCLCLFNPQFIEEKYSTEYNNDQSMSKAYRQHLDQVVAF